MKSELIRGFNRLVRAVGFSSKILGAPKGSIYLEEWITQSGSFGLADKINLTRAFQLHEKPPITIDDAYPPIISDEFIRTVPETFVVEIRGGRVWGSNGAVVTPDDFLLLDVSREFGRYKGIYGKDHPIFRRNYLGHLKEINGRVAVIGTAGAGNFYHWMVDIIPRFGLLEKAGLLSSIDWFIIDFTGLSFQRETLSAIGIEESKIITAKDPWKFHVRAETLVVPSLASTLSTVNDWQVEYLKKTFAIGERNGGAKRVYISRSLADTRKVINEASIIEWLSQEGFGVVYPEKLTMREFAGIMRDAAWVIAPEGAGLTNLVFCEPGVRIINLFPSYQVNPIYWLLSNSVGGKYGYLVSGDGRPPDNHDPAKHKQSNNFEIDLNQLKFLYNKMQ